MISTYDRHSVAYKHGHEVAVHISGVRRYADWDEGILAMPCPYGS